MICAKPEAEEEEYHRWVERETNDARKRYGAAGNKSIKTRFIYKIFDFAERAIHVENTDTTAATAQLYILKWKD